MQKSLTLSHHISFEVITSGGDKNTLYNFSNERDKILDVQNSYILNSLRDLIVKQEDKALYWGAESQKSDIR